MRQQKVKFKKNRKNNNNKILVVHRMVEVHLLKIYGNRNAVNRFCIQNVTSQLIAQQK